MSYEKDTIDLYRKRLEEAINRVPERVRNGSIQQTRSWMGVRKEATKVLNKRNATLSELMSAISSLQ